MLPFGIAEQDSAVIHVRSTAHFSVSAEPEHLRLSFFDHFHASRIISVQYRKVCRSLVLKNPGFGVSIGLKCAMPVEVVRRDIEDYRYFGTEGLDGLELEA